MSTVRARVAAACPAPFYAPSANETLAARGTVGGGLALADTTAAWPTCLVGLDAEFALASRDATQRGAPMEAATDTMDIAPEDTYAIDYKRHLARVRFGRALDDLGAAA